MQVQKALDGLSFPAYQVRESRDLKSNREALKTRLEHLADVATKARFPQQFLSNLDEVWRRAQSMDRKSRVECHALVEELKKVLENEDQAVPFLAGPQPMTPQPPSP
jgi:hypothetical protein